MGSSLSQILLRSENGAWPQKWLLLVMWASVWRKNKMGALACPVPPLNPPLQSAFQSVIRKIMKKDLVLELLSFTDSTGKVRLHYAPSICNVRKAKSTLALLIVAYTYISGKPFSSPSIYQRYQQFYGAKPCKYEFFVPFPFLSLTNARWLEKKMPYVRLGQIWMRGFSAQEPPLLLTSQAFIFRITITCFLDSW